MVSIFASEALLAAPIHRDARTSILARVFVIVFSFMGITCEISAGTAPIYNSVIVRKIGQFFKRPLKVLSGVNIIDDTWWVTISGII